MEKIYGIIEILKLLVQLFKDTDGDGRADLFDSDPTNPDVK
jgi:hypothetical protein